MCCFVFDITFCDSNGGTGFMCFMNCSEFCERIILCNSLIWSCSITGKSNLTYDEALQCEENAKKSLKEFPMEVQYSIGYLLSRIARLGTVTKCMLFIAATYSYIVPGQ